MIWAGGGRAGRRRGRRRGRGRGELTLPRRPTRRRCLARRTGLAANVPTCSGRTERSKSEGRSGAAAWRQRDGGRGGERERGCNGPDAREQVGGAALGGALGASGEEEVTASLSLPHLCRQGWLTGWLAGSHQLRKGGGGGPAVAMKSFKHACCCTLLVLPHFRAAHGYMDVLRCTTRPARSAVDVSCTKWTPNTGHSDTQRHFPFEFELASARVFLALPADCPITPPGVLQGKAGRSRGHCTVHSHMALGKLTFTEESPGGGSGEVSI